MRSIPFIKMHGIGNDFVIIDHRYQKYEFAITKISNRKTGIGCDQVIIIENPIDANQDCTMRIYNADGNEVGACGNATRCVAHIIMQERQTQHVKIVVQDKVLSCWQVEQNTIKVNMGVPLLNWQQIPLANSCDTIDLPISYGSLSNPVGVNVGNPHAVFFVDDIKQVDLSSIGPKIENHPLFPEKVNVNVAQVISAEKILLRVWERGVGETEACGSGACATLVAAIRKKYIPKHYATISLPGGDLMIEWMDNNVFMTGPVAEVFTGLFHI